MKTNHTPQIIKTSKNETGLGMEISCGKISAYVYFNKWGIDIVQNNASHRSSAYKGIGKFYRGLDEALNHYRSDAMRKILFAAAAHREALAA
jgi:hypothetical protein